MPKLLVRKIATACEKPFPLSLKQGILSSGVGAIKEHLAVLQAECQPWEVVVQNSGHMAIHAALVPPGEIMYFGGWFESDGVYRFDVVTEAISDEFESSLPDTDMFCAGHAFLADGRLLVGGGELPTVGDKGEDLHGHGGLSGGGSRACWIYQPRHRSWEPAADLNLDPAGNPQSGGRWYPTLTTLFDNQVIAVGGHPDVREAYPSADEDEQRHSNNTPERYSPRNDSWTLFTAETTAVNSIRDAYHRMFLMPDGLVFFATRVKEFNRFYNPYTGTFVGSDLINGGETITPPSNSPEDGIYYQGSRSTAVLLPLLPGDGYTPRVLISSGVVPYRITLSGESPSWSVAGTRDWNDPPERNHACSVLLPDGKVFISGGTQYAGGDDALRQQNAVRHGEIYDPGIDWSSNSYVDPPPQNPWTTVEAAAVQRHYHSVALLMPNGTVWTAGSNGPGGESNQEKRIEVYRPPYCAMLHRPVISDSPERLIYGASFEVRTPQAGSIQRVALIRNGSVTHAFDMDQRYVGLNFSHVASDRLVVTAPPHSAAAPPGFYTLWIVDTADRPCKMARFVNLSSFSVKITAAACGLTAPLSLIQDVFTVGNSKTTSLRRQVHLMQRQCLL